MFKPSPLKQQDFKSTLEIDAKDLETKVDDPSTPDVWEGETGTSEHKAWLKNKKDKDKEEVRSGEDEWMESEERKTRVANNKKKRETASFQTIEEENDFRKFVNNSNSDRAQEIKLDSTNTSEKSTLNNSYVQNAWEEFGEDYRSFQEDKEVFKDKQEIIEDRDISRNERTRETPTGRDPFTGKFTYEFYEKGKDYSLKIPSGYFGGGDWKKDFFNIGVEEGEFENEISQEDFVSRFKDLFKSKGGWLSKGIPNFEIEAIGGNTSDRIKITNKITGDDIEFDLNTASTRESWDPGTSNKSHKDFLTWKEIHTKVHKFVNGFGNIGDLKVDSPNPLLALNTYDDNGNLVNNINDYEKILYGEYERKVQDLNTKTKPEDKEDVSIHQNNPKLNKGRKDSLGNPMLHNEYQLKNAKRINGVWKYKEPSIDGTGKWVEVEDLLTLSELHWSDSFPTLKSFNKGNGKGIYNTFFKGAENYWETDENIEAFFSRDQDDATFLVKEMFSRAGLYDLDNLLTVKASGIVDDYVTISYRDDNGETQSYELNLIHENQSHRSDKGDYGIQKTKEARQEVINLHNFIRPLLNNLAQQNDGIANPERLTNNSTDQLIKNYLTVDPATITSIEEEINEEFLNSKFYSFKKPNIYKRAKSRLDNLGFSPTNEYDETTFDEEYEDLLFKTCKELHLQEKTKPHLELLYNEYGNKIDDSSADAKVELGLTDMQAGLADEFTSLQLELETRLNSFSNHPSMTRVQNFNKVYYSDNLYFEETEMTTGEYKVPTRKFAGAYTQGGGFEETKEISYRDEVEIEIANGSKRMINRETYNQLIADFAWLTEETKNIEAYQNDMQLQLLNKSFEMDEADKFFEIADVNFDAWEKTYTELGYGFGEMFMNFCYGSNTLGRMMVGMKADPNITKMMTDGVKEHQLATSKFQKTKLDLLEAAGQKREYTINPFNSKFWSYDQMESNFYDIGVGQMPVYAMYATPFGAINMGISQVGDANIQMAFKTEETGKEYNFWQASGIGIGYGIVGYAEARIGQWLMPSFMGGSKKNLSQYLWKKFTPKKWKSITNNKAMFQANPKYKGMLKQNLKTHYMYNAADFVASPFAERYFEGAAQVTQNWLIGEKDIMKDVDKAMDLGFVGGGAFGSLKFGHGLTLNYFSQNSTVDSYRYKLETKDGLMQQINNQILKINILNKRTKDGHVLTKEQSNSIEKAKADVQGMTEIVNDINAELENIVESQEKKFLKISNKYYGTFKGTYSKLQEVKIKAENVISNKSLTEQQKNAELTKLKVEFDKHQSVLTTLKNDEVFGNEWRAFEASQIEEDVARREEILGNVTTKLINDGNANPSDQQINEAAEVEYNKQEINKDADKRFRTKFGKDFNNFQNAESAIKGYKKLLNNGDINQNQYDKLVEGAESGTDLGATITLKDGNTYAYQIVENAAKAGRTKTKVHEQGHQIIIEAFGENSDVEADVAQQLLNFVENKNKDLSTLLLSRIERNDDGSVKINEVIPNFLEIVAEGKIDFDTKKNRGLGGLIGNLFGMGVADASGTDFDFDFAGETDAVNFITGLAKKLEGGELTLKERAEIKKNRLSKLALAEQNKKDKTIKRSKVYQEVELMKPDLISTDPEVKASAAMMAAYTLGNEIDRRLPEIKNITPADRQDIVNNFMLDDKRGLVGTLLGKLNKKTGKYEGGYDPNRNDSVMGYLNAFVPKTKISLLDARLIEFYKDDPRFGNIVQSMEQEGVLGKMEEQLGGQDVTTQLPEQKGRVLESLSDVELDNISEIDAEIVAEVDALIEQNPKDLDIKIKSLIENEFRKLIVADMGEISQVKVGEEIVNGKKKPIYRIEVSKEYKIFHALQFENMANSFSDDVIKKNYNNLYDVEKVSREKDKKIDEETGKVTYPGKGIYEIKKVNKAKWTKFFTEGNYTTLKDRQKKLAILISKSKAKTALDNYKLENSLDPNVIAQAKLDILSESLDNQKNQAKSFDKIKHSKIADTKRFEDQLNREWNKEVKSGKHRNKGFALEQAINNVISRYNIPGLQVLHTEATEIDGLADLVLGVSIGGTQSMELNVEVKADGVKVRMGSTLVTSYDFINDVLNVKDPLNVNEKSFNKAKPAIIKYYTRANELIEIYNKNPKNKAVSLMETTNDKMPEEVYEQLKKERYSAAVSNAGRIKIEDGGTFVAQYYANKKHPSSTIWFPGNGLYALGQDVAFDGKLPVLDMSLIIETTISKYSSMVDGVKMVQAKPRMLPRPDEFKSEVSPYDLANPISMTQLFGAASRLAKDGKGNNIINPNNNNNIKHSKAVDVSRLTNKDTETQGITVLDFDDTLATTKSKVLWTAPDGTTGSLNAEQYASTYQDLAEKGYKFDFSEFNKVVEGELAPLFNKALKLQEKFGSSDMFILTARPPEAQQAIYEFLQAQGLNIPLKNITGLGNSTSEAKALWMSDKVAEGYNDFYFADDALQNVQAVKNVLDQFDVKSKVQQAKIKFSKSIDTDFNDILERTTGVESKKRFSAAQAKLRGNKGRYKGLVPASAQDFMGLLYNFIGKGKQGDADMAFFKKALVDPFARGIDELNGSRQAASNDYKNLTKQFPKIKKKLNKKVGESAFTNDQAARVYLWNKAGFEVPGLSKRDLNLLDEHIKNDSELQAFADGIGIISKKQEGYSKPGEYWLVENIASDLMSDGAIGDARSDFLAEWKQNADQIFSEENLNKIEAIYGSKFKEALKDVLYRMESGKNRPQSSGRIMNTYMNWVNNSVGAIMFFNVRSAVLQTISATNYINWSDNNPLKAATAFANQKQYWSDFTTLFNSDYLKQRRSGNRRGVNEADLSAAVAGSKNKAKAALAWLLSKGFLPTQIADSFAIASGGATFYRNRVKKYTKEGMTKEQAEQQAFLDFQETTEVAQQSARPDMISQQQANPLGRLILSFQNTPMQYGRIMNKSFRDLANKRGDTKTHISKIIYYGGVQAIIFGALQSAIFAALGDDEEEEFDKKKERILNQMMDSWMSTFGYGGKAVSTVKSTVQEFLEQKDKGYQADHAYTLLSLLGFSPPIGSKVRKIYSSIQTDKFNEDIYKKRGFTLDNPIWNAVGNTVEGITNIPLGRISQKMLNLDNAMDANNEWWQRVALVMGWNTWDLGVEDKDIKEIKGEITEEKKVASKEKSKIKQENKQKEKQKKLDDVIEKEKEQQEKGELKDPKCSNVSSSGKRCKNSVANAGDKCTIHEKVEVSKTGEQKQCKGTRTNGKQCGMMTNSKSGYCYYHD